MRPIKQESFCYRTSRVSNFYILIATKPYKHHPKTCSVYADILLPDRSLSGTKGLLSPMIYRSSSYEFALRHARITVTQTALQISCAVQGSAVMSQAAQLQVPDPPH